MIAQDSLSIGTARAALGFVLMGGAAAQAPDVIHYTFDTSDATNFAVPGIGDGDDAGLLYEFQDLCGAPSIAARGSIVIGRGIESGWKVDFGSGDWTVAMNMNLSTSLFTQYLFGSESAGDFRCFNGGIAGFDGLGLRSGQIDFIVNGIPLATPFHVAWVYEASLQEIRVYIDGALFSSQNQSNPLDLSGTESDFDVLSFSNFSPIAVDTRVDDFRVYRRAVDEGELRVIAATCSGLTLGGTYCGPANVNSSGSRAAMQATGSPRVSVNDLTLVANGLPQNSLGIFLTSRSAALVTNPGGSQGILCLGGEIGRYVGPGQLQNSGTQGEISLTVDLNNHPGPMGSSQVMTGETWRFQAWFRDTVSGMATSNFSDGLAVVFQ